MQLKNTVALITGASSGVGAQLAIKLAASGVKVIINYANNKSGAETTLAEITANNGQAFVFQADG